jgi:hypothetical protein
MNNENDMEMNQLEYLFYSGVEMLPSCLLSASLAGTIMGLVTHLWAVCILATLLSAVAGSLSVPLFYLCTRVWFRKDDDE